MEDASKTIDINKVYLWRRFLARWIDWYIVKTIYVGLLDPVPRQSNLHHLSVCRQTNLCQELI